MPETSNVSGFDDERFRDCRFVVVKITHRCNLSCSYCYEEPAPGGDMDLSTFRLLASKVIRSTNRPLVRFVLHGGEPSLVGLDWLSEAVAFLETESRIFRRAVRLGMQSNLLPLDAGKLKRLKELGITLGASIDGPADLPFPLRPLAGEAIERFRVARSLGVRIGLLMTVNSSNWNHYGRIMPWLHREMGVDWFRANTVTSVGRGKILPPLEGEQIFRAHREIIDYMLASGGEIVEENLLGEIRRFLRGCGEEPEMLCNQKECGAGSSVLSITPEEKILPCGRFSWNDEEFFLGSLRDDPAGETLARFHRMRRKFHEASPQAWQECHRCRARRICSFGCKSFMVRSESGANPDCLPTRLRYDYFVTRKGELERLLYRIDERRRRSPPGMGNDHAQRRLRT